MKLTTISTEFETSYFLGEENGEALDKVYELELLEIPYIKNSRNVEYKLVIEHYDVNEEMEFFYYSDLDEALSEFNYKASYSTDDVNMFLTNVNTNEVVAEIENFIA